jgi:hypothetical protein
MRSADGRTTVTVSGKLQVRGVGIKRIVEPGSLAQLANTTRAKRKCVVKTSNSSYIGVVKTKRRQGGLHKSFRIIEEIKLKVGIERNRRGGRRTRSIVISSVSRDRTLCGRLSRRGIRGRQSTNLTSVAGSHSKSTWSGIGRDWGSRRIRGVVINAITMSETGFSKVRSA